MALFLGFTPYISTETNLNGITKTTLFFKQELPPLIGDVIPKFSMEHAKNKKMKEQKLQLSALKVTRSLTIRAPKSKTKSSNGDGGYTWVG